MSSIFTKIIDGEIPSHKIYEDAQTIAFLDIFPPTEGRVLVVPKLEVARVEDLPEADYLAVWQTVRQVAHQLKKEYGADTKICMKVEGFDVPHVHVHVFPCHTVDDFYKHEPQTKEPDHERLAALAKKLAF